MTMKIPGDRTVKVGMLVNDYRRPGLQYVGRVIDYSIEQRTVKIDWSDRPIAYPNNPCWENRGNLR